MIEFIRRSIIKQHWAVSTLKLFIIGVALLLIFLALVIDNPIILALILAWEVAP